MKLIGMLQVGRGCTAEGLAASCGVTRRTIFRDLDLLREAGVPLVFDSAERHYRIPGTYYLPPTNFTAEEALALVVLCHEMGGAGGGLPLLEPARAAAIKLANALPLRLRDEVLARAEAVHIAPPPSNPLDGCESVYQQLLAAIATRHCVRIRYHSLNEQSRIQTRLSPYRLLFSRRSWYVIGRSSLHRSVRTFNLGRILELQPLADDYDIPAGFSLQRYLGNAWHLIAEPGPDHEVLVRFSPMVAQNVAEVVWHRTQQVEYLPDGSIEFRATVSGLNEISWWILGYGDQAQVLQPAELREIVAARARRMAAMYAEDHAPLPEALATR
jgi:predicted DNA-binding transcriptional regulator YafY